MSLPISGFTAVPNPQMLAFMATQSFVMMMQAGEGWQYGKRKQSAMTNEEFNKQTPLQIMQRQMSELQLAIPTIEKNMDNMTPMMGMIVKQYGDFVKEIINAGPEIIYNIFGEQQGKDLRKSLGLSEEGLINDYLNQQKRQAGRPQELNLIKSKQPISANTPINSFQGLSTVQGVTNIGDRRIAFKSQFQGWTTHSLQQLNKSQYNSEEQLWINDMIRNSQANAPKVNIPVPTQTPLTTQETAQKSYLTLTINAQMAILKDKAIIQDLQDTKTLYDNTNKRTLAISKSREIKIAQNKLANTEKALINIITHARNVTSTRSAANSDWNNRIWKL